MSARNMAKRTAAGTLALAVCLGGGALALAGAAQADANFKFDSRIAGDDRYETAIAASKAAFPTDGKTENVVLVNGFATVDGLTASYLAGVANAPILYVSDKGADAKTQAEIKRLGVKNVWLVGGTTVIPQSVEDAIKVDYKVTRINGSDRYETAKLIAEAGAKISGKQPSKVFVASGTSFADALAVSPVAYAKGYAIALTEKDKTSDYTKAELKAIGSDTKILVGGTAVVSDSVKSDLGVSTRVAGDDRAVTANLVSDWAKKSEGFNPAQAALVGGTNGNGADSLVASSVLGKSLTTLHFAGWDATNVYLKDHAAELTGKGVVFGGKAAVNDDQVSKAQSAAQSVAAVTAYTVLTSTPGSNAFTYADTKTQTSISVTYKTSDKFVVDGALSSIGIFKAMISAGDTLSWSVDSSGVTTYTLVNATVAGGLVGSLTGHSVTVVDPVTSAVLATYTTNPTNAVYMLDGVSVSLTAFEADISAGDKLTVSGGDGTTVAKTQTFSLQNQTVMGTVVQDSVPSAYSTGKFAIKTAAGGKTVDIDGTATGTVITVNGTAATLTTLQSRLSTGDTVTYSSKGGVPSIALVDAAQASVSGVFQSTSGSHVYNYFQGDVAGSVTVGTVAPSATAAWTFKVDGRTVSQTEFEAAATAGDMVSYVAPDGTINTTGSISLTSGPVSGPVSAGSISGTTFSVMTSTATGAQTLASGVDWTAAAGIYTANTTNAYFVNGVATNQASFTAEMANVKSQATTGTVTVTNNNGTTEWRLTSVSAATKVTGISVSGQVITVTLNRAVYLSGTTASTDFTVNYNGAAIATTVGGPTTLATASTTLTLTAAAGTLGNAHALSVLLTDAGAAKYTDVNAKTAMTGQPTLTLASV